MAKTYNFQSGNLYYYAESGSNLSYDTTNYTTMPTSRCAYSYADLHVFVSSRSKVVQFYSSPQVSLTCVQLTIENGYNPPEYGVILLKNGNLVYNDTGSDTNHFRACYKKKPNNEYDQFNNDDYEGTDYYIKLGTYYIRIFIEKDDSYTTTALTSSTDISGEQTHYQPYEEVELGNLSATFTDSTYTYNSYMCDTTASTSTYTQAINIDGVYITPQTVTQSITHNGVNKSWSIVVDDWANKEYTINQLSANYALYTGKVVGNDFLTAFNIKLRKYNSYGEEISYPKQSLELARMSKTIISESDNNFTFNYNISDITETSTTSLTKTISSYHKLATGSAKYANVQRPVSFELGDIVGSTSLSGALTYDDGTTVSLADCGMSNSTITSTLGTLPQEVTIDTPSTFNITYTFDTTYLGSHSITDGCFTEESAQVGSVVLESHKVTFYPNDVIDFGDNAVLKVYNQENELVKTITRDNFQYYVTNKSGAYDQYASNYLSDNILTLTFHVYGREVQQKIVFIYDEAQLILDVSNVTSSYIFDTEDSSFDFDYTGLEAYAKRHTNSIVNGEVSTVISNVDVSSSVSQSHSALNPNEGATYGVLVSMNNSWGQALSGTFSIYAEPLKPTRIDVAGTSTATTYYDNDADTFKLPSDLTFEIVFNDTNENITVSDISTLEFYRDAQLTQRLVANTTIVKNQGQARIYAYSPTYNVVGSYAITFIEDTVTAVNLKNEVTFFLGNRLNKASAKSQVVLLVTHASTIVEEISDVNRFSFDNTSIIMSEPISLNITVDGTSYAIANYATKVVWSVPVGNIRVNYDNFQTEYNNTVDIIYPNRLNVAIDYYEDNLKTIKCDYTHTLTYSSTSTSATDKFTVAGNGVLQGYDFGNDIVEIDMDGESLVSTSITLSAKHSFENSSVTYNIPINIFEILNITGIKLLDAKTEYNVNETFLNETDNTRIIVYYVDTQDVTRTYTCYLRNAPTALNIYPLQGTKFTKIANNKVITITSATNSNIKVEYAIDVKANYIYGDTKIHNLVTIYLENYVCPDEVARTKYYLIEDYVVDENDDTISALKPDGTLNNGVDVGDLIVRGYLEDVGNPDVNARVILFEDYISPIEGSNNITCKFPCYVEGNADLVNKCHFGIMFGNNNSKNRLFISGNTDYPNKDWHSSQVDIDHIDYEDMLTGNYGYFEDLSECVYGETDNAVVGYDIVSNDKLLVLKDHSDKETTVYFRQPQLVTAINGSGTAVTGLDDETLYQEEFSLTKGNNSVAGVSPKTIINFNGDTLFISEDKTLCGLDLTGIIGDNQRYANSRSYYIDEDLKHQDLANAILWSNNKYLMIVVPNKVYVTQYELKSETQYEWFVLDVANVASVLEKDGVIYFGTHNGELYRFSEVFRDARKVFIGYGTAKVSINENTELFTATGYLTSLDEDKKYYFRPVPFSDTDDDYIYYSLATANNSQSGDTDFYIDNSNTENVLELLCLRNGEIDNDARDLILKRIAENRPVYLNKINSTVNTIECRGGSVFETAWGKPYYLKLYSVLSANHLYQLVDENGNIMPVKDLYRARLCYKLTEETEMVDIDTTNGEFKLKADGEILNIVQYNAQLLSTFRGEIIEYSNVEAFYITKPYEMGNLEYFKTIWSFTLTNDSNIPSELELCYVTNKIAYETMKTISYISKDALGFDISSFNFYQVDFDKNVVPRTYTYKRVLSSVKFMCFGFRNYNNSNSVLSSMTITYTLPYPSYSGN